MIRNFTQASTVSATVPNFEPLPVSARDVVPREQFEEGEVSDSEHQPDLDTGDSDRAISEDQNYRETIRRVRVFII